jgi:hypothetical protein
MRRYALPFLAVLLLPAAGLAEDRSGSDVMLAQAGATTQMKKHLVFFDWDKAVLTAEAKKVVATAADDFKKTGAARLTATGHTDTSGPADYNMRLSIRRAEAVKAELVRLGVPANVITTVGKGQTQLLVPTPDNVREAQNRRVEIEIPVPVKPVAAAPAPAPAAAPPPPVPPKKWAVSLGPWYGYNLRETDRNDDLTSHLLGPDLGVEYMFAPGWAVAFDLVGFTTLNTSASDGYGGRGTLGVQHVWDLGAWHPYIGPKVGYVAGSGVQDSPLAGPEVGVKVDVAQDVFLYAKAGYDVLFLRNEIDQGVINGGLGAGMRF